MWAGKLLDALKLSTRPPDRRSIVEWCEEHIKVGHDSAMPGPWRIANSPHVRRYIEAFQDPSVKIIIPRCAAQTSKTFTTELLSSWAMSEDPGPSLWLTDSDQHAEELVRDRIGPLFRSCEKTRKLITRETKNEFAFGNIPYYFSGSGSAGKVASKPIRYLYIDEACKLRKGMLSRALKRIAAFWNSKTVITSTPENTGDEFDVLWKQGTSEFYFIICPECKKDVEVLFDHLKWDTNETTKKDGHYIWSELEKTIRFECPHCKHRIEDNPVNRRYIADSGRYVATNPNAPKSIVSLSWNALIPPLRSWLSIVQEFLNATDALKLGNVEPMRVFITETLGLPWEDRLGQIEDFGFLEHRKEDYKFNDEWPDERIRFMAADRQAKGGEHYWWVVRAFGPGGKSRLIAYGRCETQLDLEERRKFYHVEPCNSIIDIGYKANDTKRFCVANGWQPMKGDKGEYYTVTDASGKQIRRIWKLSYVDPAEGTATQGRLRPIKLWRFISDATKDALAEYMTGLAGEWTIPQCAGRDYMLQLTAEERKERRDNRGHEVIEWHQIRDDNHMFDCEQMIHIAAIINKVFNKI